MTTTGGGEIGSVTDVVCGMTIDGATAAGTSEFERVRYYFCSPACKSKFDADPERYARGSPTNG